MGYQMRFYVKFLLLVGVQKETDFFSMYNEGFLLIRCNSMEAATAYLKGASPIDAVLLDADHNPRQAAEYCESIKTCRPKMKVVLLRNPEVELTKRHCADLVLDSSLDEVELARQLALALVPNLARTDLTSIGGNQVAPGCLTA
jgi:hypothetical protein